MIRRSLASGLLIATVAALLALPACGSVTTESDLGSQEAAVAADMTANAPPDLRGLPDLASLPDLTALPDLTPSPDLTPPCTAVLLDGVKAVVSAAPNAAYDPAGPITMEASVYPTGLGVNAGQVVIAHAINDSNYSWALVLNGTRRPAAFILNQSVAGVRVGISVISPAALMLNTWSHIAAVFDSTAHTLTIYVNGKTAATTMNGNLTKLLPLPQTPLTVGALNPIGASSFTPYVGYVSEARVSSIVRYAADFTPVAHFSSDANTIALFHFDETRGTVAHDSSPTANDGTLLSSAAFASPPTCH